jgi:chemotaxis protein MotB
MADDSQRPIIVKRIKKGGGGHHGGAWKIAYADFVTAMMAFFLLMWLLGSTAKGDLHGISEFFKTPLQVALFGGSGSGDASHVIKGGGRDLTRTEGQIKKGDTPEEKRIVNIKAANAEAARQEAMKLAELKQSIEELINNDAGLKEYRSQMLLDITQEGLRIQIVDAQNRPMFASGSAEPEPFARQILLNIAKALNGMENRISLSGHTDAQGYASGDRGYSNWELSSDRANASRRVLVAGGLDEGRLLRVVGAAAAAPFDARNSLNPVNRRISIIVLKKQFAEAVQQEFAPTEAERAGSLLIDRLKKGGG